MNYKQITCVITKPIAMDIIKRLEKEKHIITANSTPARGTSSKSNYIMKAQNILTVLVKEDLADDIFYYLYSELELDQPHQGIIYQENVSRATKYSLPDLP